MAAIGGLTGMKIVMVGWSIHIRPTLMDSCGPVAGWNMMQRAARRDLMWQNETWDKANKRLRISSFCSLLLVPNYRTDKYHMLKLGELGVAKEMQ